MLVFLWSSNCFLWTCDFISYKFVKILFQVFIWWNMKTLLMRFVLEVHRSIFLILASWRSLKIHLGQIVSNVYLSHWRIHSFFYWWLRRMSKHNACCSWFEMLVGSFYCKLWFIDFWSTNWPKLLISWSCWKWNCPCVKWVFIQIEFLQRNGLK